MDAVLSITQTRLYNQRRSVKFRPLVLLSLQQQQQQQRDIFYSVVVVIYSCSSLSASASVSISLLCAACSRQLHCTPRPPSLPLPPQTIRTIIERRPAMPTTTPATSACPATQRTCLQRRATTQVRNNYCDCDEPTVVNRDLLALSQLTVPTHSAPLHPVRQYTLYRFQFAALTPLLQSEMIKWNFLASLLASCSTYTFTGGRIGLGTS